MRKVILSFYLLLIIFSSSFIALAGPVTEPVLEKNEIKVFYDDKLLSFTSEPIMMKGRVLVPLRQLAEQMGASVDWRNGTIFVKKNGREASAAIGNGMVLVYRDVFFMDQPPIIINEQTFVPIRFIDPILYTKTEWDEESQTVYLTSGGYDDGALANDKYYKLYNTLIGPSCGPSMIEARQYALDNGLLTDVEYARFINPKFALESNNTAVFGYSPEGRYKVIWLEVHKYWRTIEIKGEAFLDEGVSEDRIKYLLKEEGFRPEEVKDIFLAIYRDYEPVKFAWHAVVSHNGSTIYYFFDFKTGELVPPDYSFTNPFFIKDDTQEKPNINQ